VSSALFHEPNTGSNEPPFDSDDLDASTQDAVPVTSKATLDIGDDEPLTISNFQHQLPEATTAKSRSAFVRAAEAAALLDEDGRHALARALVKPDAAVPLIKSNLLINETLEAATLTQVPGHVWTHELWPLLQPRTEAESLTVERPKINGSLGPDGAPHAILTLTFHGTQHLADYLHQTITHTGRTGMDYAPSILARRVGRPVLAHVVRLAFEDGTPGFSVLAVRDGITRLFSSVAARLGRSPKDDEVAQQMIADLLATVPPRAGKEPDASQDHARGREKVASDLRARFNAGVASGEPTEDAVRIGQTFTLPAQTYVSVQTAHNGNVPSDQVFAEAIRAVVGSIHTEFRGWDVAAMAVDVGERALQRAQYAGDLQPDVVRLATGVLDFTHTPEVFGDSRIPRAAIWRAVYIVHALTQQQAFNGIKEQLRSLLGMTNIQKKRFIGYLGPLVDVPWRASKARSLVTARRAWTAGGPIPHALLGANWEVVPTDDFLTLVPLALEGDIDARRTLQVAGGIALVADRLLTSNTGSAVEWGTVPFRAEPQDVIANLGAPNNKAGLYQLAYAAQAFSADVPAVNSFTKRDFADESKLPPGVYVVPQVDDTDPEKVKVDGTGSPVGLTQFEVVTTSNPERARKAITDKQSSRKESSGYVPPASNGEKAKQIRWQLLNGLKTVQDMLGELETLIQSGDPAVGPALSPHEFWSRLSATGNKVSSWITMHEPPEEDVAVPEPSEEGSAHDDDVDHGDAEDDGEDAA
jgi:hypothetical protein